MGVIQEGKKPTDTPNHFKLVGEGIRRVRIVVDIALVLMVGKRVDDCAVVHIRLIRHRRLLGQGALILLKRRH